MKNSVSLITFRVRAINNRSDQKRLSRNSEVESDMKEHINIISVTNETGVRACENGVLRERDVSNMVT